MAGAPPVDASITELRLTSREATCTGPSRKAGHLVLHPARNCSAATSLDILISQRPVVVEADGNMHLHARSSASSDAQRDADMRAGRAIEVFRFDGKPICNDADGCASVRWSRRPASCPRLTRSSTSGTGSWPRPAPTWKGGKPEWTCATCGKKFRYLRRQPRYVQAACNRMQTGGASGEDRGTRKTRASGEPRRAGLERTPRKADGGTVRPARTARGRAEARQK